MDFDEEDRVDTARYNRIVWAGIMGNQPYPTARSGLDLRVINRKELLKDFEKHHAVQLQSQRNQQSSAPVVSAGGSVSF
jgi:hypothetical protein